VVPIIDNFLLGGRDADIIDLKIINKEWDVFNLINQIISVDYSKKKKKKKKKKMPFLMLSTTLSIQ